MRRVLEHITPEDWDSGKAGDSGFPRVRYLQQIDDTINRPLLNRVTVTTNATAVNLNGSAQSTGIGCGPIQPLRYAELTVKARVTFNISGAGALYVYVYRTIGAIPANGAAPGGADVVVGGDAFGGPATVGGQNIIAAFSMLDTSLNVKVKYRYYFAFNGTNALVGNLVNHSNMIVMERS
jgi:hypothetical protein